MTSMPLINTKLGKYLIEAELGKGGMAAVYRSTHPQLNSAVAIKVIYNNSDEQARQRFLREAQLTSKLSHPNIVRIFDVDDHEGRPYLVMELVEGASLQDLLKTKGRLDVGHMLDLGIQLADALNYAHSHSMLHRDLKPANILIRPNGTPVIVDFGLARLTEDTSLTQSGMIIGTVPYMAPEQLTGKALDARTDIYALGVVFFRMLTGRLPFEGDSAQMMFDHVYTDPPVPSTTGALLPPALDGLIMAMLAKDPQNRPQTMAEVSQALRAIKHDANAPSAYGAYIGQTQSIRAPTFDTQRITQPSSKPRNQARLLAIGGGLGLGLLILLGIIFLTRPDDSPTIAVATTPETTLPSATIPPAATATLEPSPTAQASATAPVTRTPLPDRIVRPGEPAIMWGNANGNPDLNVAGLIFEPAAKDEINSGMFALSGVQVYTSTNYITLQGFIKNTGDSPRANIQLDVLLLDADKNVLGVYNSYARVDYLAPNEVGMWVLIPDAPKDGSVTYYTISVRSDEHQTEMQWYNRDVQVSDLKFYDENGLLRISGKLTNTGVNVITAPEATIALIDSENRVIDIIDATPTEFKPLAPNETVRFDTISWLKIDSSMIKGYYITARANNE